MIKVFATVVSLMCAQAHSTCFEEAGARYNVNPDLLRAMAKVESSMRSDAINATHKARTKSVDLGFMQINSRWLPTLEKHNITREALLQDACLNLKVGAWILSDNMRRHGPNWTAVGAYNAACTELKGDACEQARNEYATKVWQALSGKKLAGVSAKVKSQPADPVVTRVAASRIASVEVGYVDVGYASTTQIQMDSGEVGQ